MEQLIKKYKNQKFTFDRYYKYDFWYVNDKARVKVGGDGIDIYRSELIPVMTLKELIQECGDEYLEILENTE